MCNFFRTSILVFFILSIFAEALYAREKHHPGYLDDVEKEKYLKVVEFELPPDQQELTVDLQKLIFTKKFSKDMLSRYHRRFGYTETQISFQAPNRYEEFTSFDGTRVTLEEDVKRKRKFGNYMLRKLTEYHIDEYLKGNNNTKTLYAVKKQLSNASVGVGGGFKLRAKYSLSGKELKLRLKNPYGIKNELIIDFDSDLDFSGVNFIYHVGVPGLWNTRLDNYYDTDKEDLTTVLRKYINNQLNFSITNVYSFDEVNDENKVIFGVNWRY